MPSYKFYLKENIINLFLIFIRDTSEEVLRHFKRRPAETDVGCIYVSI